MKAENIFCHTVRSSIGGKNQNTGINTKPTPMKITHAAHKGILKFSNAIILE